MIVNNKKTEAGKYFSERYPRVMAHRGASGLCPENTLVSFEQAIEDGADVLEMDVRLTADLQVMVVHDATVERTTDGRGLVAKMRLAELQELDAGYRFTFDRGISSPFRGKGIAMPTFEQVLQAFPQVPINVEIKDNNPVLVSKMKDLLEKYDRFRDGSVLVAAEKPSLMRLIRQLMPNAVTGFSRPEVYSFLSMAWLGLPAWFSWSGQAIQIPVKQGFIPVVSSRVIRAARRQNVAVHAWTANTSESMRQLLCLGVDGLFTDFPGLMRKTVDAGNWSAV